MTRLILFVVGLATLLLVASAKADVAPPIWLHHASVTTVLEVTEAFPDYVVFRVSMYRTSAPGFDRNKDVGTIIYWDYSAEEVSVHPNRPARITGDNSHRYSLYAVPRSAAEPGREPKDLVAAVDHGKVPGAARLSLSDLEQWDAPDDKSDLFVRYRLERTRDGGVAFTRLSPDGKSIFDSGESGYRIRWIASGVAAAVAFAALGLWRVRRRRNRTLRSAIPPATAG